MSLYDTDRRTQLIAIAILFGLVLVALLVYLLHPRPVSIVLDTTRVAPGDNAILRVIVQNPSDYVYSHVFVYVRPLTPYLKVYADQNGSDPNLYVIPAIAPKGSAQARFLIHVREDAYAGRHGLKVFVALPGETIVRVVHIEVE